MFQYFEYLFIIESYDKLLVIKYQITLNLTTNKINSKPMQQYNIVCS